MQSTVLNPAAAMATLGLPLRPAALHRPPAAMSLRLQPALPAATRCAARGRVCAAASRRRQRGHRKTRKSAPKSPTDALGTLESDALGNLDGDQDDEDDDSLDGDLLQDYGTSGRYRPGMLSTCRALILDSAYRPIRVVGWQRAVRAAPPPHPVPAHMVQTTPSDTQNPLRHSNHPHNAAAALSCTVGARAFATSAYNAARPLKR